MNHRVSQVLFSGVPGRAGREQGRRNCGSCFRHAGFRVPTGPLEGARKVTEEPGAQAGRGLSKPQPLDSLAEVVRPPCPDSTPRGFRDPTVLPVASLGALEGVSPSPSALLMSHRVSPAPLRAAGCLSTLRRTGGLLGGRGAHASLRASLPLPHSSPCGQDAHHSPASSVTCGSQFLMSGKCTLPGEVRGLLALSQWVSKRQNDSQVPCLALRFL